MSTYYRNFLKSPFYQHLITVHYHGYFYYSLNRIVSIHRPLSYSVIVLTHFFKFSPFSANSMRCRVSFLEMLSLFNKRPSYFLFDLEFPVVLFFKCFVYADKYTQCFYTVPSKLFVNTNDIIWKLKKEFYASAQRYEGAYPSNFSIFTTAHFKSKVK